MYCCGLYCGECIPRDQRLLGVLRELKSAIDEIEFDVTPACVPRPTVP
jgi:hypothetical protein